MSEGKEWIDSSLDGSGGGFGRFKGMTVREVSQSFAKVAEERNMRGVSAILRISREQLEGRSQLAVSTQAAWVLGVVTILIGLSMLFVSSQIRAALVKALGISAILFIGFLSGALSTRKLAKAAVAQDRAICSLAVDALEMVLSNPEFKPKPLDSLQKQTLKGILKKTGGIHPEIEGLLSLS